VPNKLFYTVAEACEVLGIKRAFLYELLMRQEVPSVALGRRRLIPVAELERWAAAYVDSDGRWTGPMGPRRVA
jgi:excisionase family DNA binding protein